MQTTHVAAVIAETGDGNRFALIKIEFGFYDIIIATARNALERFFED